MVPTFLPSLSWWPPASVQRFHWGHEDQAISASETVPLPGSPLWAPQALAGLSQSRPACGLRLFSLPCFPDSVFTGVQPTSLKTPPAPAPLYYSQTCPSMNVVWLRGRFSVCFWSVLSLTQGATQERATKRPHAGGGLEPMHPRAPRWGATWVPCLPGLCLVTPLWWLEMSHSGSICTTEISQWDRSPPFPLSPGTTHFLEQHLVPCMAAGVLVHK